MKFLEFPILKSTIGLFLTGLIFYSALQHPSVLGKMEVEQKVEVESKLSFDGDDVISDLDGELNLPLELLNHFVFVAFQQCQLQVDMRPSLRYYLLYRQLKIHLN